MRPALVIVAVLVVWALAELTRKLWHLRGELEAREAARQARPISARRMRRLHVIEPLEEELRWGPPSGPRNPFVPGHQSALEKNRPHYPGPQ